MRYVVFDTETPNCRDDRMSQIGLCVVEDGEISRARGFLVNPECDFDAFNVMLTGISPELVYGERSFPELWRDELEDFFSEGVLVAHNAPFDSKFVRYYGEEEGYMFEQKVYDTVSIAQSFLYLSNYKLNTLADHYGITFNHHRAADDALATAKIFIEMIKAKKCLPKA